MDTIARHARKLVKDYLPSPRAIAIVKSAKLLAKMVLKNEEMLPAHRRKVLSSVQWMISKVDGKYSTRYRSEIVVEIARSEPTSKTKINHEHVFTRKYIIQQLLANPQSSDQLLDQVIACVVTKDEHDRLSTISTDLVGWGRYTQAGITVIDMLDRSIHA
jgi:hypothetical protein